MAENNNLTVWQRLGKAFGPNSLLGQDMSTYKFDKKELLRTKDRNEYEKEKLQGSNSLAQLDKQIIDFKKYVKTMPIEEVAKPTGVKQISSYIAKRPSPGEIFSEFKLKAPVNTKAAVYYNDLLKFKKF